MKEVNRNASSAVLGYEFQINIAILFMFRYLKDIISLEVEGEKEDIEITFADKNKYMIQAKSQTKDLNDNKNNISKLKKSLISLAEADNKNVKRLYYVSNMTNPLNTTANDFDYSGITEKFYNELSLESKDVIDTQIKNNIKSENDEKYNIDTDKLVIMKVPFFGTIDREKHKYIVDEAKTVLALISDTLMVKSESIIKYCESKFIDNGTNPKVSISKKEFCNWIILTELASMDLSNDNINIGIEDTEYYDAYQSYQKYVDEKISTYENYLKVYSLYNRRKQMGYITINEFVKQEKLKLYNFFFQENLEKENQINDSNRLDVYISQIISYAILKKKSIIDKIKKEPNL